MKPSMFSSGAAAAVAVLGGAAIAPAAEAATQPIHFNTLTASATVTTPFLAGDTLFVDTLVTSETGPLTQTVDFTVGAGVTAFDFRAAWLVSAPGSTGPRLVGVNIDVLDASNTVVFSDDFQDVVGGFAVSTGLGSPIGPGSYTLLATGTGQAASSLDVSLNFLAPVPEPQSLALMLAGLGTLGVIAARRR